MEGRLAGQIRPDVTSRRSNATHVAPDAFVLGTTQRKYINTDLQTDEKKPSRPTVENQPLNPHPVSHCFEIQYIVITY